MKNFKYTIAILFLTLFIVSCDSDDDTPEIINEEELITTVIVTLSDGENTVTLTSRDLDGDGPNPPEMEVSGNLSAETTYTGSIQFLNELESPADNITLEVQEEDEDHQVFYISGGELDITTTYLDFDPNGNPLGTAFLIESGAVSSGTLNVTLRHLLQKPNDGTLADAGGDTDASVTFGLTVE